MIGKCCRRSHMYRNENKSTLDGMSNHFIYNSAAEAWLVGLRYKITIHYRLEGWRCLLFFTGLM